MTTHLTDTQKQTIRIALARWSGWTEVNNQHGGYHYGYSPKGIWGKVSDCCASLDACHEIIRHLYVGLPTLNENLKSFRDQLAKIKGCAWYQSAVLLSANAEEVSLALYLSLNLGELGD